MDDQVSCPVCTLYLRSGITLADHLNTHPKESVIAAFVNTINKKPDPASGSPDNGNINNVPSVMYQQFVNNYGPVNNGNYHNTVITANVPNPPNSTTIPVIVSPPSQQLPQLSGNPEPYPVNYNPYQPVYNYDYPTLPTSYPPMTPFPHGQVNTQERSSGTTEIDPLSNQTTEVPEIPFNPPPVLNSDIQNGATHASSDTNVCADKTNREGDDSHNNEAENRYNCERQDATNPCSENCEGDFLDLDNQNHNTNIGTVISNSHQIISQDEYNETEVNSIPSDSLPVEEPSSTDIQNGLYFSEAASSSQNDDEMFIAPEHCRDFPVSSNISSPRSHHSSMESLLSDSDDEEFVICDDIETAKRNERESNHHSKDKNGSGSYFHQGDPLDSEEDVDDPDDIDDDSVILSPIINIETDEMMPPHGELSGQDSMSENSLWSNHCDNSSPPYQILYEVKQEAENKGLREQGEDVKPEKCPTCSASFSHPDRYKIHIQSCSVKNEDPLAGSSKDMRNFSTTSEMDEKKCDDKKRFQCICCSMDFESQKLLSEHVNLVHSLKSNQCPTCLEVFTSSIDFKTHVRTVHPLECTICGKYFNTRAGLQLHRKRHLSIRPYSCSSCNKSFVTKQKLQEHMNVHLNRAPIKCKLCPDNVCFKSYSNLIQHRRVVHAKLGKKIKDYFCDCGELFHSKKRLFWHAETHGKPKACRFCSRKFMHLSSLTRHIRRMHDQSFLPKVERENRENVSCPVCKQTFLRTSLASHLQTHSGKKPYSCDICNKNFTTKWNLNAHRWIHMSRKLKPHKCKLCNAAFVHLTDLQAHERSHSKTRPFSCNHCGKQFIHQYNCIRHVREHEQEKRFTCEVCKKTFHRSYYLSEHLKIHTGFKPFSCHICGKLSTTKSNHNKHVRTHHAREPVSSEV